MQWKLLKQSSRKSKAYRLFWNINQRSYHGAYSDDTLNANEMNAKPGGKQPLMHDTVYNGKPQSMKKRVLVALVGIINGFQRD